MKCRPTYVSVSPQTPLFQPIFFSPHAPVFSRSHEFVSQQTTERLDVILDLPNSEWFYTLLMPQDSLAEAVIYNQLSLDIVRLGLPPIASLDLNRMFTT